jgi:hypothetical protein
MYCIYTDCTNELQLEGLQISSWLGPLCAYVGLYVSRYDSCARVSPPEVAAFCPSSKYFVLLFDYCFLLNISTDTSTVNTERG